MSTRNRIERLESNIGNQNDLLSAIEKHGKHLVGLLARTDSLWWPFRGSRRQGVFQARREYRKFGGFVFTSSDSTGAGWKRDQRLRDELVGSGAIEVSRASGAPRARLTEQADLTLRKAIGMPLFGPDSQFVLEVIGWSYDPDSPLCRPGNWVSETKLFDQKHPSSAGDWFKHEEQFIPFLVSGCLESDSTAGGHCFYRVVEIRSFCDPLPIEHSESLKSHYLDCWTTHYDNRHRLSVSDSAEVFIPLSETR
jgi:hypothetical protein